MNGSQAILALLDCRNRGGSAYLFFSVQKCLSLFFLIMFPGFSQPATAEALLALYEQAFSNAPAYLMAIAQRDAQLERQSMAKAFMLPRVSYQYRRSRHNTEATQDDLWGRTSEENRSYNSYESSLNLQQTLVDYSAWSRYRYERAQLGNAELSLRDQREELALRLTEAYIQALQADEQINISLAEKRAYAELLAANRQMLDAGEGTRTDVLETSARHELVAIQEIEHRDALNEALHGISAMIGEPVDVSDLALLKGDVLELALDTEGYDSWKEMALRNNARLAAHGYAIEAARQQVREARAGYLPTFSMYASVGRQESSSETSYGQRYETNSVGVQLNVPIYAGGTPADVRRAASELELSRHERKALESEMLNELRRQLGLYSSSRMKIAAYESAVQSAYELLQAMKKSVMGGERVNADILQAEQQYFSALRSQAEARYAYLLAWLRIRFLAGVMTHQDLVTIDELFKYP